MKLSNELYLAFSEEKTIYEWRDDKRCVVKLANLRRRIKANWDIEKAITTPELVKGNKYKADIKHPLYNKWKRAKIVGICNEWKKDYQAFYDWGAEKYSDGLVLRRRDINLPYSPNNCYFATKNEVATNNQNTTKARQTCLRKYGVTHYNKTDEYTTKLKQTCLEKYGVEHHTQSNEVKEKAKNTNLKLYGYENPLSSPTIQERVKKTNLERRGVEYPSQDPTIMSKIKETMRINGTSYDFEGLNSDEWAKKIGISRSGMNARIRKYGYDKACSMDKYESSIEQLLKIEFDSKNINYFKGKRIGGKFPDFIVEDKLVIEADGLYWHSDSVNKDNKYHSKKRELYIKEGYIPLFFREDEIETKLDIIMSIICNKLNRNNNKIFARKCKVVELDIKDSSDFFSTNHLMGKGRGKTIALTFNGKIVSAIRFTKHKEYYDISRYCCKKYTTVVGGLSKLLSKVPKDNNIRTFIDLRYGMGDYLIGLGFKLTGVHNSFRWVKNDKSFHRMKFPGNSGYDDGFFKIWDCGQASYIKQI